ncbi:hypothetical protein CTI12_AA515750 [Artemisia annua]|uniref:Uncharacterized protein n=1 Tax=Artemisia annua TaxID=35608 RepID=A0A2U1L737_ARTAN|nr:hypothetical protein CTI12_AA515750 [Artemisia annua]
MVSIVESDDHSSQSKNKKRKKDESENGNVGVEGKNFIIVCKSFDAKNCILTLSNNRKIKVTREMIHDILGIPMGDVKVVSLPQTSTEDPTTARWRARLPLSVYDPDGETRFLVVFFSLFAHGNKDGTVNQRFLPSVEDIEKVPNMDWCTYCLECMQADLNDFNPRSSFAGPDILLVLIYVNSTISTYTIVNRTFPAFKAWSTTLLNQREKEEIKGGFGQLLIVEGLQLIEKPKKENDNDANDDEEGNVNVEKDCNSNGLQVVINEDMDLERFSPEVEKVKKSDAPASVADSPRYNASDVQTIVEPPSDAPPSDANPGPDKRKVILSYKTISEEKKVVEYLWSTCKPASDIAFKTKHYELQCKFFESLFPEVEVAARILDAWSIVLSDGEKYKKKLSLETNVYCKTGMLLETMTDSLIENGADKIKRAKVFDEMIKDVLKVAQRKKFRHIDLVDSFVDYLRRVKHPSCTKLLTAKPKYVKVPWITKCIDKYSGVFVIRCMETYLGVGCFLYYLKKEEEGVKTELKMLRMKMLRKMILLEINDQREVILKEANVFVKNLKECFKLVTNDNVNDNQDLLDKITERVKMIS